jgi:hypothetical protein
MNTLGPSFFSTKPNLYFVKPFYSFVRHSVTLFLKYYHGSQLRVATMTNGSYPQIKPSLIEGVLLLIMVKLAADSKSSQGIWMKIQILKIF